MRIFDKWPWTNIHELNLDWILENMRKLLTAMDELSHRVLPPGGTNGQVLAKNSADDFDVHWVDQQGGGGSGRTVPDGGDNGQVLTSDGANGYDWANLPEPREVPSTSGANSGDVLTVDSHGDYDWQAPPSGGVDASQATDGQVLTANGEGGYGFEDLPTHRQVPTGGTNGQVLTAGADNSYAWQNPPSPSTGREVPDATGETAGKVLTTDGEDGYGWETPSTPREVPPTNGASDGDVLTVDGQGNYGWEALPTHRQVSVGGTNGQVLTANGSGGYGWAPAPGAGQGAAVGAGELWQYRFPYSGQGGETVTIPLATMMSGPLAEFGGVGQIYGVMDIAVVHFADIYTAPMTPIIRRCYIAAGASANLPLFAVQADGTILKVGTLTIGFGTNDWSFTYEGTVKNPAATLFDCLLMKWVVSNDHWQQITLS